MAGSLTEGLIVRFIVHKIDTYLDSRERKSIERTVFPSQASMKDPGAVAG